ncbi:MAG TPA: response regulator transcription factor [Acidimicrobiales bacterium]|nr:response regulator transcription factor [Acidimicrobiales bacterium]
MSDAPDPVDGAGSVRPLRVVIVDDHEVLRAGTRQILETADDIVVVGEADDGDSAIRMVKESQPDVVLVDIRLPGDSGIEVARQVCATAPDTKVVILSAYDDASYLHAALAAGAAGYLLKTMPRGELINAVRAAGLGTTVLDASMTSQLSQPPSHSMVGADGTTLTTRERQVIELVAEGLANKAIAARLGISARTIEGHLNHVFAKLGVSSRTELVRFVLDNNLTDMAHVPRDAAD